LEIQSRPERSGRLFFVRKYLDTPFQSKNDNAAGKPAALQWMSNLLEPLATVSR